MIKGGQISQNGGW